MGDNEKKLSLSMQRQAALAALKALEAKLIDGLMTTRMLGFNANYITKNISAEIQSSEYIAASDRGLQVLHQAQIAFLGKISKAIREIEADKLHRGGSLSKSDFQNEADADSLAAQYQDIATQAQDMNAKLAFSMQNSLDDVTQWNNFKGDSYIQGLGKAINNSANIREGVKGEADAPKKTGSFRPRLTTSSDSNASSSSSSSRVSSESTSAKGPDNRDRDEQKKTSNAIIFVKAIATNIKNTIDDEGILRISGNTTVVNGVQGNYKKNALPEKGNPSLLSSEAIVTILNPAKLGADYASVLKKILMDPSIIGLKNLDIPDGVRGALEEHARSGDADTEITGVILKNYLMELPASHVEILKTVFELIKAVAKNSNKNKMDVTALSTGVGESLLAFMRLDTVPSLDTELRNLDTQVKSLVMTFACSEGMEETFTEVLQAKHTEQDMSDAVYTDKNQLNDRASTGSRVTPGWASLSRRSKAPVDDLPAPGGEPKPAPNKQNK